MYKRPVEITRIKKSNEEKLKDTVLIETPVDIIVDSEPLVNIISLPKDFKELAVGFLFSIGIINSKSDIQEINVDEVKYDINIKLAKSADFKPEKLQINPISRVIDTTCGISSPWRDIIKSKLEISKDKMKSRNDFKIKSPIIFSLLYLK